MDYFERKKGRDNVPIIERLLEQLEFMVEVHYQSLLGRDSRIEIDLIRVIH
jgi:hypothetical protein